MIRAVLALGVFLLLYGAAHADDARQLRREAGALVQAAEYTDSVRERRNLLEDAYIKLEQIRQQFPSASRKLELFVGGERVGMSPDDVLDLLAAARIADGADVGQAFQLLGREPSPTAADENGWTDLHFAAALNLPMLAEELLDGGASTSRRLNRRGAPLSEKMKQGLLSEPFKRLIERNKAVHPDETHIELGEILFDRGFTPLHVAAAAGAAEVARLLIERGADVHAKDAKDREHTTPISTPIHAVALSDDRDITALLIENGADVRAPSRDYMPPLHLTAMFNAAEVAVLLIDNGADVNEWNQSWGSPVTALHLAAFTGAVEVAALLIELGADMHAQADFSYETGDGATPLHVAASRKWARLAAVLIENGADVDATTESGQTPLHLAAAAGAVEVAVLLAERGASLVATNEYGQTPLEVADTTVGFELEAQLRRRQAAAATRLPDLDVGKLREVLGRPLSATAADEDGWTDLHYAAALNLPDLAAALLDAGADIAAPLTESLVLQHDRLADVGVDFDADQPRMAGETPLHVAALVGAREVAALLLDRGADVDARTNDGWTPLHVAAWNESPEVAAVLVDDGAEIGARLPDGRTPLYIAAERNAAKVAALLVDLGAEVNAKTGEGWTPLQVAESRGHREVLAILRKR